ncbi:hypothetical protein CXQ85_003616 [Candidozyma haemuli]|uniref:Uncharacterized protein n=1 Tax=Candidozyma haemuli TaxID=45357 RepID=A0A2V1API2_9ASCO|nr:hypothetical protein CXQ85_003616 [[Candida] haemuloni]PVH19758.1 hypothetical protein CXQ85_003616 [[Candida] haemuloni]
MTKNAPKKITPILVTSCGPGLLGTAPGNVIGNFCGAAAKNILLSATSTNKYFIMTNIAGTAKDIGVGLVGSIGGNKVADAVGGGQASHIVGGVAGGIGAGKLKNKGEQKVEEKKKD